MHAGVIPLPPIAPAPCHKRMINQGVEPVRSGRFRMRAQRLGIVIPYRDRPHHLQQIIPHLGMYFTRDKLDNELAVTILVVEQSAGAPFNRGFILNVGYRLLCDRVDYVCFHDVDYLPIWADYSRPDQPTMIIWYGLESRPIDPAQPQVRIWHGLAGAFGAVVLMRKESFERANGFSNHYWGWGPEDVDLKSRLELLGYVIEHRRGTFKPLDHRNQGFEDAKTLTPAAFRNLTLFESKWLAGKPTATNDWQTDGLNGAQFKVTARAPIILPPGTRPDIVAEHVVVNVQISGTVSETLAA